jgi:hypothetical protein
MPPIKTTGTFKGKSNTLGHGGRAAQLKAQGVPGGVIGELARKAQAAPGQKNYHPSKGKKKVTQKGPPVPTRSTMKGMSAMKGGTSAAEFKGGSAGLKGMADRVGSKTPAPKAAQKSPSLSAMRKSDNASAKKGRGNPDK